MQSDFGSLFAHTPLLGASARFCRCCRTEQLQTGLNLHPYPQGWAALAQAQLQLSSYYHSTAVNQLFGR